MLDPFQCRAEKGLQTIFSNKCFVNDFDPLDLFVLEDPELSIAASYPDTDEEVITAIIMRFLMEKIFKTTLYGIMEDTVSILDMADHVLKEKVEPKRGALTESQMPHILTYPLSL